MDSGPQDGVGTAPHKPGSRTEPVQRASNSSVSGYIPHRPLLGWGTEGRRPKKIKQNQKQQQQQQKSLSPQAFGFLSSFLSFFPPPSFFKFSL